MTERGPTIRFNATDFVVVNILPPFHHITMAIEPSEAGPSTPPIGRQPAYKLAHSINAHAKGVTALRFSPNGQSLVSGGMSNRYASTHASC